MEALHQLEIIIVLLAVVLALTSVARKLLSPYPIILVIGGLVRGVVPGLPTVTLNPDLIFLVFLPPILWAAAYFTSLREFRENLRPMSLLAIGLVLATTAAVAVVAHAVFPGMSWAAAIALGAIVSPPDAVAATAIGKRLRIPRRIVTILEGESLVNDATALVLDRTDVGAAVSGTFVLCETLLQFVFAAIVGVAIGIGGCMITRWALHATEGSFTEIAITLLAPYFAWLFGEFAHACSVLACVAGGIYLRQHFSEVVAPAARIQGRAVWDLLVFMLNGVIFILIGLQLGVLSEAVPSARFGSLLIAGALVSATAILVRLVWVPLAAALPRLLSPSLRARDPLPPWSYLFIVAWAGIARIVTLPAGVALPGTTAAGAPFPFRAEIILISFSVILATLVLQGLSLTPLIRALRLEEDRGLEKEEMQAREHAATAALARLDGLAGEDWLMPDHAERLRVHYGRRLQRYARSGTVDEECTVEAAEAFRRLRHETRSEEHTSELQSRPHLVCRLLLEKKKKKKKHVQVKSE